MANNTDLTPSTMNRGKGFLHEVWVELKKTTWPTWEEAWRLTMVVVGVIIVIAIYIGVIDYALTWITTHFGLLK
jgi:preprotein translocase subunit SecE